MLTVRRDAAVEPVVAALVAVDLVVVVDGVLFLVVRAEEEVRDADAPAAVLDDADDAAGLLPPTGA